MIHITKWQIETNRDDFNVEVEYFDLNPHSWKNGYHSKTFNLNNNEFNCFSFHNKIKNKQFEIDRCMNDELNKSNPYALGYQIVFAMFMNK